MHRLSRDLSGQAQVDRLTNSLRPELGSTQHQRVGAPSSDPPRDLRQPETSVSVSCNVGLLRDLTTNFAARIGRSMDVDVVLAGLEVGGLGVGHRGAALDRALAGIGNRDRNTGVLAGLGGT